MRGQLPSVYRAVHGCVQAHGRLATAQPCHRSLLPTHCLHEVYKAARYAHRTGRLLPRQVPQTQGPLSGDLLQPRYDLPISIKDSVPLLIVCVCETIAEGRQPPVVPYCYAVCRISAVVRIFSRLGVISSCISYNTRHACKLILLL